MLPIRSVFHALIAAILLASPQAQAAFPTVALKAVCLQQIHSPTTIAFAPDGSGRLFVCDQVGKIYIIQGGMLLPTPFLNIASPGNALPADQGPGPVVTQTTGYSERGLLGLAFHPGYANPMSPGYRKFYVNYNKNYAVGVDPGPPMAGDPVNCVTVIAEFEVSPTDPNVAILASERRLLIFTQPQSNHNGGMVEFGPDGLLYIGSGDGGSSNDNNAGHTGGLASPRPTDNLGNSLDRTNYLGKILRIDPLDPDGGGPLTYSIPATNPFFANPAPGLKKEIYAEGLRNPWKFSFDYRLPNGTNRLFCGDVGQGRIEEINLIVSGGNFGWRFKEGVEMPLFSSGSPTNPMPDPGLGPYIDPIAMYAHPGVVTAPVLPQLGLSVTGGYVYRGAAIPALQGKYIFGDYGSTSGASDGRIMGLEETALLSGIFTLTQAIPIVNSTNPVVGQRILCLGEDASGEIYIGMKTNAGVLALDPPLTGLPAGGIYKIVNADYTTTLPASKDNTIFSEENPPGTFLSDALGFLYAGRTNGESSILAFRRALVAFNVAPPAVPAGAVIQSAQLKLTVTKAGPNATGTTMTLNRLTQDWGEGTSMNPTDVGMGDPATTGDATWMHRFFNTSNWTNLGGTFSGTTSATAVVPGVGLMTWGSTATMVSNVQGWVNTPTTNFGWIVQGDEATDKSACQFGSIQKGATPPALTVAYQAGPQQTHFEAWLLQYFPTNLVGQYVDLNGDLDGDGIPTGIEYAFALSPVAANPASAGLQAASMASGVNTVFTYTFRRDPLAVDLTYLLQTSSDLVVWTTITQSAGGADSSGSGFVSDSDIIGEEPMRLVTAQETLPSLAKRFVRLRILRMP